jgi:hypothetical protein
MTLRYSITFRSANGWNQRDGTFGQSTDVRSTTALGQIGHRADIAAGPFSTRSGH